MSIQKMELGDDMILRGIKFKLDFLNIHISKVASECKQTFSEVLKYDTSNVYDNKNNNIMTILKRQKNGVLYQIVLKDNSFIFYADFNTDNTNEGLIELKRVVTLFLDFVYKLENGKFSISNLVFTKFMHTSNQEIISLYENDNNVIAEDNVGLKIKCKKNEESNLLLHSYFLRQLDIKNFSYNIEDNIRRLYNIYI